jgi:hypothetical protein
LQRSFPPESFFNLKALFELPQPNSILVLSAGSRCRTASITVTVWRRTHALEDSVQEHFPLLDIIQGERSNSWWDSPPICDTLHAAYHNVESESSTLHGAMVLNMIKIWQSSHVQLLVPCLDSASLNTIDAESELSRRILLRFLVVLLKPEHLARIPSMFKSLPKSRPQVRIALLQTMLNAWTTSTRAHESVLRIGIVDCLGSLDTLKHDVQCEHLWPTILSQLLVVGIGR